MSDWVKMAQEDGSWLVLQNLSILLERFARSDDACTGLLHGVTVGDTCHVISCSSLDSGYQTDVLEDLLPAGIEICGVYMKVKYTSDKEQVELACQDLFSQDIRDEISSEEAFIVVFSQDECQEDFQAYSFNLAEGVAQRIEYQLSQDSVLNQCMLVRLRGSFPISREYFYDKEKLQTELDQEMSFQQERLASDTTGFLVRDASLILSASSDSNLTCRQILEQARSKDDDQYNTSRKRKVTDYSKEVLELELLCQRTGDEACSRTVSCAPLIHHNHGRFEQLEVTLPVDVAVYAHPDTHVQDLIGQVTQALCNQLAAMSRCLVGQDDQVHTPVPYHFKPDQVSHLINVVYPRGLSDQDLEERRRYIHCLLHLPDDQPQVHRLNAYLFPDETVPGGCLINPHEGLPSSGVEEGRVSVVRGLYAYHHYMQDRMDDSGWGCAYRSLQTLVSWFRLQGYTDKPVPTHRQIQQALVDVGDKETKFVGSKKWIGSMEVSYVLDHLFGITSRILFVSSGAELETKGRELSMHFQTQGTPIMIGGGVLAHTILGVDFSEVTGAVKYLILDPHYTGGEDLKVIQGKGWCGWKGQEFWDQNAYYNLCMPQTPKMI